MKKNSGFTLIELLVVIVIIGILAGAVLLAINPAELSQKARDAKRLSDLDTVRKGLDLAIAEGEVTLVDETSYTQTTATTEALSSCSGTPCTVQGWVRVDVPTGKTGLSKYLPALPMDPSSTGTLFYVFASTATQYELKTQFETDDYKAKYTVDGGNEANYYEVGSGITTLPIAP